MRKLHGQHGRSLGVEAWPGVMETWAEAWETGDLTCELGSRELAKLCSSMEGTAGVTMLVRFA